MCSRDSIASSMSTACQPRRFASARATVVLPAPMKPTRYTFSARTAVDELFERLEEARIRDVDRLGAVDARRPIGGQRRDRERHGHAVIALRVGDAAGRTPGRSGNVEPVRTLVGIDAKRAKAGDER